LSTIILEFENILEHRVGGSGGLYERGGIPGGIPDISPAGFVGDGGYQPETASTLI
jgi:hypothetical protein